MCNKHSYWSMEERHTHATSTVIGQWEDGTQMGKQHTNAISTVIDQWHNDTHMQPVQLWTNGRVTRVTTTAVDQWESYSCNYDSYGPMGERHVQLLTTAMDQWENDMCNYWRQLWTNGRTTRAITDDSYGPMGEWHVQLRQLWTSRNDTCNYDRYRPMEESHVQILQLPTNGRMTHSATDTGADDMHNAWMTSDNSALFRPSVWHPTQCTKASLNLSLLSNSFHSKESNLETV